MFSNSIVPSSPEVAPAGKKLHRLRGTIRTGIAAAAFALGSAQMAEAGPASSTDVSPPQSDGTQNVYGHCLYGGGVISGSKLAGEAEWFVSGPRGGFFDDSMDTAINDACPDAPAAACAPPPPPVRPTLQECRGEEYVGDEIRCLLTGSHFEQADKKIKEAPAVHVGVALTFAMEAGCKEYATSIATGFEMSVEKEKESREDFDLPAVRRFLERECKDSPDVVAAFDYYFK